MKQLHVHNLQNTIGFDCGNVNCAHKNLNAIHMWQSRVENEHYSVSYFDRVSAFET